MQKIFFLTSLSALTFFGCNRNGSKSDVQFALIKGDKSEKDTLLRQIYKNKDAVHVCIINEDPAKNQKWLNAVESGFEQAFASWHAEGLNHPKFPLPKSIKLDFKRIPSSSYLKMQLNSIDRQARSASGFKKVLNRLMSVNDKDFPKAFADYRNFLIKLEAENRETLEDCPKESVKLIAFSDPAAITSFENEINKKGDLSDSLLNSKQQEDLTKKFVRIMYKGKMTYEQYNRRGELAEKNKDYLVRGYAKISPPSITIQQTDWHEKNLNSILTHETGHLFGLGDVYVDRDLQTDLKAHPVAVMGNHYSPEVQGKIQSDDIRGLLASITLAQTLVKECGEGYHEFDNSSDGRSVSNSYCLPDGFEEQNFGVETDINSTSKASTMILPPHQNSTYGAGQAATACPANMTPSGSSGICCPVQHPYFDPLKVECVEKKMEDLTF